MVSDDLLVLNSTGALHTQKCGQISRLFIYPSPSPKQRIKQSNTVRTFADWVRCAVAA